MMLQPVSTHAETHYANQLRKYENIVFYHEIYNINMGNLKYL